MKFELPFRLVVQLKYGICGCRRQCFTGGSDRMFAFQEHKACFKRRATAAVLVDGTTVARFGFARQTYS